ncbi:hypothetical protein GCM10025864_09960 [Luteimicrobium album]|uniref:Uncharacterized protein n=1 Tax=Luteimicrobium album TaxID=1054550 RepID=A0ABQ6HZ38_9MICO|nr:hypothetical protein [Luteimicrobium album]GMA23237.1 hypothetical protein GCM10025864_09960 [Luteimicrobium album]
MTTQTTSTPAQRPLPERPAVPEWKRVKRRRRRRDLLAVGVVVALGAGTLAGFRIEHGLASGPLAVATLPKPPLSGSEPDTALVTETLHGSVGTGAADGTACFWFVRPDGVRGYVVWPHGWSAEDRPLRILNDWGKTVATVGDRVEGGGAWAPDRASSVDVNGCPAEGTSVAVGDVARAG